MARKLTLLIAAVAVLAVAVPTAASAAARLEMPEGTLVPTGTAITGTSTNAKTTTSLGTLECAKVVLNGKVETNNGTTVKGVGTAAATTTTCSIEGESINITDVTLSELHSEATGSGKATFSFKADLPVVGTCSYTGTNVPFTWTSPSSKITFTKATLTASPAACGSAALDADFTLATSAGGAVILK